MGRWVRRARQRAGNEAAELVAGQQLLTELMTEQQSLRKNNGARYKMSG